jgi:hypothetical protein
LIMLLPFIAMAGVYGLWRWNKARAQAALDKVATSPAPVPPGFAPVVPSQRVAQSMLGAVKGFAGLGGALPQGTYGKGATTLDVPSGRIPSSLYGTGTAPAPSAPAPTAPAPVASAGISTGFKFKI